MGLDELIARVREWQRTMSPEEVRARVGERTGGPVTLDGLIVLGVSVSTLTRSSFLPPAASRSSCTRAAASSCGGSRRCHRRQSRSVARKPWSGLGPWRGRPLRRPSSTRARAASRGRKGYQSTETLGGTPCDTRIAPPVPAVPDGGRPKLRNKKSGGEIPHLNNAASQNKRAGRDGKPRRPYVSSKARALLPEHPAHGPRLGAHIEAAVEAAGLTERALLSAADALGVRTQRGPWWLPG